MEEKKHVVLIPHEVGKGQGNATLLFFTNFFISASQAVPTFVKDIIGERVQEEEAVTYEAIYSGTPTPGKRIIVS